MSGNADKLRAASAEIIAVRDLVYGAEHVAQGLPASRAWWAGLAADGYEAVRAGPKGALDTMNTLIQALQSTADWLDKQAHQVDESHSFLHSVLGQILIAVATFVAAIAAAFVAPVLLAGIGSVVAALGTGAVDAFGLAETASTGVAEGITAGAADLVGPSAVEGAVGAAGTSSGAAGAVDAAEAAGSAAAEQTAGSSATVATTAVSPSAQAAMDGLAAQVVPQQQAALTQLLDLVGAGPAADSAATAADAAGATGTDAAAGAADAAGSATTSDAAAATADAAGSTTGSQPAAAAADAAGSTTGSQPAAAAADGAATSTGDGAAVSPEIQPAPLPAAGTGGAGTTSTTGGADAAAAAADENAIASTGEVTSVGGSAPADAATAGQSSSAAETAAAGTRAAGGAGLALPSAKEVAHTVALLLTQSGTDAAGQTLVQAVSSAIEHHGQFWKLSKDQGLLVAASSLGIPLAQAFNLLLRSAPWIGRNVFDVALNWKIPKLPTPLATLGDKPQLNIFITYGNAGVAAYGLDSRWTGQPFSVVGALISYGGYGVLAASDQWLIASRRNWLQPLGRRNPGSTGPPTMVQRPKALPPSSYPGGKQGGGRGGYGTGSPVSVGPAGHGWSPDPGPYLKAIGPKIANRAWYYALDHEWVYGNSGVPGVHDGTKLYVIPGQAGTIPAPGVTGPTGTGVGSPQQPAVTPVSGVSPIHGGQHGEPPGQTPSPSPVEPPPTPAQVRHTLAQDQQMLQQQQRVLNDQLAQLQQLRGQLRQLAQSPAVLGLEQALTVTGGQIAEQQHVLTEDAQAIGELQAHPDSPGSISLIGPASAFVQASWREIVDREFVIAHQIDAVQAALPQAVLQARHWPPVPSVAP